MTGQHLQTVDTFHFFSPPQKVLMHSTTDSLFYLTTIVFNFVLLPCHTCGQSVEWATSVWGARWQEVATDRCQIKCITWP